jgi:hypothetical protein
VAARTAAAAECAAWWAFWWKLPATIMAQPAACSAKHLCVTAIRLFDCQNLLLLLLLNALHGGLTGGSSLLPSRLTLLRVQHSTCM